MTTTDPFTEAAHAEAERLSPLRGYQELVVLGAGWARTHLAAQEPTEGERAVRELHYEREWRQLDGTFIGGTVCNACRRPYPCPTINVLARATRRDEETR